MSQIVDFYGNEVSDVGEDVILWEGSHKGYSHEITLNEDVLKFKEMICIVNNKAVIFPIINNEIIVSPGMVESFKVMSCSCEKYDSSTHAIKIGTCIWTNSTSNEGATLTKVYGRY